MFAHHECGWNDLADQAFRKLGEHSAAVPAGHSGWFRLTLPSPLSLPAKDPAHDGDRLLIVLDAAPAVRWATVQTPAPTVAGVEYFGQAGRWGPLDAALTMRLDPAPNCGEAVNVLNGWHRRLSRAPLNMWVSAPGAELPQTLTLVWGEPMTFDRLELTFDNLARTMRDNPWEHGSRAMPSLVCAYTVKARTGADEWTELARERDNVHRHRIHEFTPVTASELALHVLATHGEKQGARVYSIAARRRHGWPPTAAS